MEPERHRARWICDKIGDDMVMRNKVLIALAASWLAGTASGQAQQGAPDESTIKGRSEEHTSELQSLMRISYAVFCLKKKNYTEQINTHKTSNAHHKIKHSI